VLDTRPALADMAGQIKSSRSTDGLTLQQLATRSGVAASTIHKVESQQMVPTVSVLLKIAKGLGRRPEELIRDEAFEVQSEPGRGAPLTGNDRGTPHRFGVWRIDLARDQPLPSVELESVQRAIVLVEKGAIDLQAGERHIQMNAGESVEIEGGRCIEALSNDGATASVTLIVTPPGSVEQVLGAPV